MSAPKIEVPTVSDITDAARDFLADPVSSVSNGLNNVGTQLANGVNNVGTQIGNGVNNAAQQTTDGLRDGIAGVGQNFERNAGRLARDLGRGVFQGNFTGFDRTLLDTALFAGGGMYANPDDVTTVTGMKTGEQQLTERAEEDAANQKAAVAAAEEQERLNAIKDVLTGQAAARQRNPGRASIFNTGGGSSNYTLLTGF